MISQLRNQNKSKKSGKNQVIIQATVDIASKTKGTIDMWYSNIYELYISSWKLYELKAFRDMLEERIIFQPRTLKFNCANCWQAVKSKNCIQDGKYCPIYPTEFKYKDKIDPFMMI